MLRKELLLNTSEHLGTKRTYCISFFITTMPFRLVKTSVLRYNKDLFGAF